jgi:predicted MPP superfamily phosphohydrolase
MKHLAWMTDIHLNFASRELIMVLARKILDAAPDAVLLGGDIGEADNVGKYVVRLGELLKIPIFFVLGNHDYYRGSIAKVRKKMADLSANHPGLHWLSGMDFISLSKDTALVGHDSWADGRLGNGIKSTLLLNDYLLIQDFIRLPVALRFQKLNALGDEAARHFARVLPKAFEQHKNVILLTHVPPFRESCWHEGGISDDDGLPHFSCKAAGDVMLREMQQRPAGNLLVLCGHTHSSGEAQILPNLCVRTGGSIYGSPAIQSIVEVS